MVLVFVASASVLVLEILAARLLAPYVGVTLETFTGIIGTVLAGISAGAWVGGRLADRHDPASLLGPILVIGGGLAMASPSIVAVLGPELRGGHPINIVALATAAFFAPALVLSGVTPIVAKLLLSDLGETGAVVGRLSAIGTAGAIAGTFVTGFVLLANVASRPLVLIVGALLVVIGVVLGTTTRTARLQSWALVGAAAAGAALLALQGPCLEETAYVCAQITEDPARASGRVLWLDTTRHSYVDLDDPAHLEFRYAQLFGLAIDAYRPMGRPDALFIGGGGFTFPRWFAATRAGGTNLVLELDEGVVAIAEERLGFDAAATSTEVVIGDARTDLADVADASVDVVVGDAFGGYTVPWHLTTVEFHEDLLATLRPGGLYVLNVIDYPPLEFVKAQAATLATVFDSVLLIAPDEYLAGEQGGNFVFVASPDPLDPEIIEEALAAAGHSESVVADVLGWADGAPRLIDDFAPVDQLITRPG
jgi:MFS family permease